MIGKTQKNSLVWTVSRTGVSVKDSRGKSLPVKSWISFGIKPERIIVWLYKPGWKSWWAFSRTSPSSKGTIRFIDKDLTVRINRMRVTFKKKPAYEKLKAKLRKCGYIVEGESTIVFGA